MDKSGVRSYQNTPFKLIIKIPLLKLVNTLEKQKANYY